ncbi:MAG: DUF2306 domain-containing protein [Salaquimonas sp.]
MNLQPFFNATPAIQIHMVAAVGALVLGAIVLWKKKGNRVHKLNGRIWVALMMVTALSGFFIHEIKVWGNFSPIHIFSIVTPISLLFAIYEARKGDIDGHQRTMKATYIGGMLIAGGFTFLPGRLNHEIFFGDRDWVGLSPAMAFILVFAPALLVAAYYWRSRSSS